MSLHTPPSSYILRDLSEVVTPDSISWFPQTLGWQIVAIILIVFVTYKATVWGRIWWGNRYRREALGVVIAMKNTVGEQTQITYDLFEVMKAVVVYLNPNNANAFGNEFLKRLDGYFLQSTTPFYDVIGENWMQALLQKKHALTAEELNQLLKICEGWLRHHQGENHAS
jgi:hypothetical protein